MTVWKAGMLAVCVDAATHREWGNEKSPLVYGSVYLVTHVWPPSFLDDFCGLELAHVTCPAPQGFKAARFRPAVEDSDRCEDEFITLLKRSKPAPAQPQKAQVGDTVQTSPHSVAVAVEGTAMVSPDPVETITHTDRTEGVTHRDLSQHAIHDFTNSNGFTFNHEGMNR